MTFIFWSLPTLAILVAIGSGRLNTVRAAALGLAIAIPVALLSGPTALGAGGLAQALARGLWIGATIAPYILGGLLFWQVAARGSTGGPHATPAMPGIAPERARRRLLFFACFLVGPFAESATGFGVGMLGTVAMIRGLGIAAPSLMIFALLSQTMIPWGAMGSGTLLAAAYARVPAAELGLYALVPVSLLMAVWLPLFWRTARRAGFAAPASEAWREAAWVAAGLGLLAPATAYLGPETALLAAYGPLIVLRYGLDWRPDARAARAMARQILPYVILIGGLVLSRLLPVLKQPLEATWRVAPFADLPAWSPFFHAGSWLLLGGVITALLRGQARVLAPEARAAWRTGKVAVLTVFAFAMMAEVLTGAGISQAFAAGLFDTLRDGALLATPLLAALFGILANSGNAPNSLFMPSQVALAVQAGLSVPAVAALLHVAGTSMSLFSPVRMAIAAGMCHGVGDERRVYAQLLPWAGACMGLLLLGAAVLAAQG